MWPDDTTVGNESPELVFRLSVLFDCRLDPLGWRQATSLPFETTLDSPTQNACALAFELLWQPLVPLRGRNGHIEGNQQDSSPDCDVGASKDRPVIRPIFQQLGL